MMSIGKVVSKSVILVGLLMLMFGIILMIVTGYKIIDEIETERMMDAQLKESHGEWSELYSGDSGYDEVMKNGDAGKTDSMGNEEGTD